MQVKKLAFQLSLCLVLAAFIEVFTHCGSPLSSPLFEADQQMFFMSAKAWWNGLLPYRDCADVKGPFLYLFYLAGYLLSPVTFHGVFAVQIVWSALLFFVLYRTARLFLDPYPSTLALCITLGSIYFPYYHDAGSRAEDVMMLPISLLLYAVCRYVVTERSHAKALLYLCALNGAVAWILFFIKYNACFINVAIAAWLIYETWNRGLLAKGQLATIAGGVAVILPVGVYLIATGTFSDFIAIYFKLNAETYTNFIAVHHAYSWKKSILGDGGLSLMTTCAWLAGILLLRSPHGLRAPLLLSLAGARLAASGPWPYYLQLVAPFGIFPAVALVQRLNSLSKRAIVAIGAAACALIVLASPRTNATNAWRLLRGEKLPATLTAVEEYMQSAPNSSILVLNSLDPGLGTSSHQMPAGTFWCSLNGMPHTVEEQLNDGYRTGAADFVIVGACFEPDGKEKAEKDLRLHGYHPVMEMKTEQYVRTWKRIRIPKETYALWTKAT